MSSFIGQDQFEKIKYKKKLKIYKHKELKPKFHAIRNALAIMLLCYDYMFVATPFLLGCYLVRETGSGRMKKIR